MGILLHDLSHFFEILTGVYFGGFALLVFLQRGAKTDVYVNLQKRVDEANTAEVITEEYFKVRIGSLRRNIFRYLFVGSCRVLVVIFELIFTILFNIGNSEISKIGKQSKKTVFLKKYFPSFFFSGCFCLIIILFSSVLVTEPSEGCKISMINFLLYYLCSSLIFQLWAIFIFPRLVNKIGYLHLLLFNILFATCLMVASFILSKYNLLWNLKWFLDTKNKEWAIAAFVAMTSLPLVYIITKSMFVIVSWECAIIFNKLITWAFGAKKSEIIQDKNGGPNDTLSLD